MIKTIHSRLGMNIEEEIEQIKKHLKTKKKTLKNNARIFTYKRDDSKTKFNVHSTDVN